MGCGNGMGRATAIQQLEEPTWHTMAASAESLGKVRGVVGKIRRLELQQLQLELEEQESELGQKEVA